MFQLSVTIGFSGAHQLHGYDGPCSRMHGHNFKVEARVSGKRLDGVGMLIDFKTVKQHLKEIIDTYDHQFLNDIPPFNIANPTAENLARYIYEKLCEVISSQGANVDSISVWETDKYGVTYTPDH